MSITSSFLIHFGPFFFQNVWLDLGFDSRGVSQQTSPWNSGKKASKSTVYVCFH
ncbi:hypothetical protein HanRHA438_Chr08g0347271 [Helianthus annuus]|nr:hypothetical protein HanHA300_Chr08g0277461 [Helianthus annuus]KAJ0553290.1 hypothetical protein HanHA89_Chr08g0294761 [Helianthus annuus]KAJ0722203.1 hypothetical protein HanOQP8_Chr08g0284021 [Helianthus annuus]KAJ0737723.1 hypothetical protein HanLR1_Chr06g0210141 [Helianthus annuus]KAJ0897582.1 hypothetical protein HanRHA438_Chr08g0347271 [Helianthus annuus]